MARWSRRITGMRNFRQALASPHPGGIFTIRSRPFCIFGGVMMKPRLAIALLSVILISGCAARSVHVAQLKDQPARYYNKTVSVTGTVTNSWGIPLVPFQLYSVDDGTGQIT